MVIYIVFIALRPAKHQEGLFKLPKGYPGYCILPGVLIPDLFILFRCEWFLGRKIRWWHPVCLLFKTKNGPFWLLLFYFYLVANYRAIIFAVRKMDELFVAAGNGIPGTKINGGLAQLARALAWHVRGHRFDPDILHEKVHSCCEPFLFKSIKLSTKHMPLP